MMHAPLPLRIWMDRRFALAEDDIIFAGHQEHHLEFRCMEDLLQPKHLGIKLPASFEIADCDAKMDHAPGLYGFHCCTMMLIHSAIYQQIGRACNGGPLHG